MRWWRNCLRYPPRPHLDGCGMGSEWDGCNGLFIWLCVFQVVNESEEILTLLEDRSVEKANIVFRGRMQCRWRLHDSRYCLHELEKAKSILLARLFEYLLNGNSLKYPRNPFRLRFELLCRHWPQHKNANISILLLSSQMKITSRPKAFSLMSNSWTEIWRGS